MMMAILFSAEEPFKQLLMTLRNKSPMGNVVEIGRAVSEIKLNG